MKNSLGLGDHDQLARGIAALLVRAAIDLGRSYLGE